MRALVFLLIFANLVAFALTSGVFGTDLVVKDDGRPHVSLSPDQIRIVSTGEPPPVQALPPPPPPVSLPKQACLLWQDLSEDGAGMLEGLVDADSALKLVREETSVTKMMYWVHMPAQKSGKAGAQKKAAEVRELGVTTYSIISSEGADQWAISFGVYSSLERADVALEALRKSGVRSAIVRERENVVPKVVWRVTGVEDALVPYRTALIDGVSPQPCPAPPVVVDQDAAVTKDGDMPVVSVSEKS